MKNAEKYKDQNRLTYNPTIRRFKQSGYENVSNCIRVSHLHSVGLS